MINLTEYKNEWSLFLDRDGVINKRIVDGYVKKPSEFEFLPGSLLAIEILSNIFNNIFIVTNQQGVGKGLMTGKDVEAVNRQMIGIIKENHGRISRVYYCPDLATSSPNCRKPGLAMANMAKKEFPAIDFRKSYMIGDSLSDMEFGKNAEMKCVFIGTSGEINIIHPSILGFTSLLEFANHLKTS